MEIVSVVHPLVGFSPRASISHDDTLYKLPETLLATQRVRNLPDALLEQCRYVVIMSFDSSWLLNTVINMCYIVPNKGFKIWNAYTMYSTTPQHPFYLLQEGIYPIAIDMFHNMGVVNDIHRRIIKRQGLP